MVLLPGPRGRGNSADFAVLTPSWGYGRFIADAVDSVALQRGSIAHVIQDAGSTDETAAVLEQRRRADLTVRVEPDDGQSDALNRALALAPPEAEWLGWLNADEFYLPGAVDAVAAYVREHPNVDVVYGDCVFVDEQGRLLRLVPSHPFSRVVLVSYGCFISSCATFTRRDALTDGWNPDLRRMMDWDLWLRLSRSKTFGYLPRALAAFRIHSAQVTAVPHDRQSGESQWMRAQHGVFSSSRSQQVVANLAHAAAKVAGGGYRRQAKAHGSVGQSMLWWKSEAERAAVKAATSC